MSVVRQAPERVLIDGAAGAVEILIDVPPAAPGFSCVGIALIAHPHPLFGGTFENKVVQTLARVFTELGYAAIRPNFRGAGASAGVHDEGRGETEDTLRVIDYARGRFGALPVALAGFSFGSYVLTRVAKRMTQDGFAPERMVLVGTSVGRSAAETVPADTIVIHGENDETVPLAEVLNWARPQELPVIVIPGADHFFHRRLHLIRNIVSSMWAKRGV
jgi:alpha/beta superfamily hydrolase